MVFKYYDSWKRCQFAFWVILYLQTNSVQSYYELNWDIIPFALQSFNIFFCQF